jgi:beta-lactamase superfamily II metal-dependent hydrolase
MSRASWFLRMRVGYAPPNGLLASLALALLSSAWASASPESKKPWPIFFADVEGGQATLFVTPVQHALPIDTGWRGSNGRDADRIVAVAGKAGISQIDDVLITHFHNNYVGGLPQLVARIPFGTVIDHGDNRVSTDAPTVQVWQAEFIANPEGPDAANYLELTAWPDGSPEVFNSRTKNTKRYPAP